MKEKKIKSPKKSAKPKTAKKLKIDAEPISPQETEQTQQGAVETMEEIKISETDLEHLPGLYDAACNVMRPSKRHCSDEAKMEYVREVRAIISAR